MPKDPFICSCNCIPQSVIEEAMRNGAKSMGEIFDQTTAGCGPCGGSCRPTLKKMLEHYRATGAFLPEPKKRHNVKR